MSIVPTTLTFAAGVRAFDERDYRTAAENFLEVLAEDPHHGLAREYLARAYYHRASLGRAEEQCRTILAADPTDEYALLLLARSIERQGRADEALGIRRQLAALTGDPQHLPNHTVAA
ncbi:tetratricopeptide repeat protein [Luteococcus sp. Sow4_B9]|uniref:tetratricopeptide repeat protein n=1 Tax=Luteococcus sp. Sow4_B9 TaxID=3438792 RepID=UPI003F9BB4CB